MAFRGFYRPIALDGREWFVEGDGLPAEEITVGDVQAMTTFLAITEAGRTADQIERREPFLPKRPVPDELLAWAAGSVAGHEVEWVDVLCGPWSD